MRKAVVALAGTLDTKSTEYEFVKNEIIKFGCDVLVIDTGIFGGGSLEADIKNDVVAREGGVELSDFAARVEGDTRVRANVAISSGFKEACCRE